MQLNQIRKINSDIKLDLNKVNPPSEFTRDYRVEVVLLPIEQLRPYKLQARKIFDEEEISKLADTIKDHGIRNPLTVTHSKEDGQIYDIISGERRWRAAKLLNMDRVPCIVINNGVAVQEIALIENIQRKDLNTIELLEGIELYINNNPNLSREEAFSKLGMSKTQFYRILKLTSLSSEARQYALTKSISFEKLTLVSKANPERQLKLLSECEDLNLNTNSANTSIGQVLGRAKNKKTKVLDIKIKGDQIESDANFYVLSNSNKTNMIAILKRFIIDLEEEDR